MTAIQLARDPEQILHQLPEGEHERFLAEYQTAAEAAVQDLTRYKDLQQLLQRWSVIAVAVNQPGYDEALEQARTGEGEWRPLEEVIARRQPGER